MRRPRPENAALPRFVVVVQYAVPAADWRYSSPRTLRLEPRLVEAESAVEAQSKAVAAMRAEEGDVRQPWRRFIEGVAVHLLAGSA